MLLLVFWLQRCEVRKHDGVYCHLKRHGVTISMDGKGRCMDNIFVERLWRSLKYEEVYPHEGGEMLAFAHIPTGTTVNKAIDIKDSKGRGVAPITAPTMIGADIETGGATP